MKSRGKSEKATPVLEAEERDFYTVVLDDLPKKTLISISVLYSDVKDPANYEIGETPDGHLEFTFPVVGKNGTIRVFANEGDDQKHLGSRELKGADAK